MPNLPVIFPTCSQQFSKFNTIFYMVEIQVRPKTNLFIFVHVKYSPKVFSKKQQIN